MRFQPKMLSSAPRIVSSNLLNRSKGISKYYFQSQKSIIPRRNLSGGNTNASKETISKEAVSKESATKASSSSEPAAEGTVSWWNDAKTWGAAGAAAGWGMSGAAIYDSLKSGPEIISLNMTGVLLVYSSLFAKWAYVVKPRNMALCLCHVANVLAQTNQLRRALEFKMEKGEKKEVNDIAMKAAATAATGAACVVLGPVVQSGLTGANLGVISTVAAADAGPFTVHFWAPMSKWLISGASFMDLNRPTDKISIAQYSALTLTGFFFSRYALLVKPINFLLCSVNIALFGSSSWHLGRKIKADYIDDSKKKQ